MARAPGRLTWRGAPGRLIGQGRSADVAGKRDAARILAAVADFRLGDRNTRPDEALRIKRLAQRYRGR